MSERTIPARMPEGWAPPVPAHSAVITSDTAIAYYGVQSSEGPDAKAVEEFRTWIVAAIDNENGPDSTEWAQYEDADGAYTWIAISYWAGDLDRLDRWTSSDEHQDYWSDERRLAGPAGTFREIYRIPPNRFETLLSQPDIRAGAASAVPERRGPIQEHNYWGGTRDRITLSANDPLESTGGESAHSSGSPFGRGARVRVRGRANLAVIRSGQHLDGLEGREKEFYAETNRPCRRGRNALSA